MSAITEAATEETTDDVASTSPPASSSKKSTLTKSAKWIVENLGHATGQAQLTESEKKVFQDHWLSFSSRSGSKRKRSSKQFGSIDFAAFCHHWNSVLVPKFGVSRKTVKRLKEYFKESNRRVNAATTVLPVRAEDKELRKTLRTHEGERSKQPKVSSGLIPRTGRQLPSSAPPAGSRVDVAPLSRAGIVESREAQQRILEDSSRFAPVLTKSKRRPAICRRCGHAKHAPHWSPFHDFNTRDEAIQCRVPVEQHRPGFVVRQKKQSNAPYDPCRCPTCRPFLEGKGVDFV